MPVSERQLGVVAAGHPLTAQAGADVLRQGGNAVDAALGAMLASFVCEPLLTGLGAGGYMLVSEPGQEPVLLDFFVEAPGHGADPAARSELVPISVSFGDAIQVFNIGAASIGAYGTPIGLSAASERFGTVPLADLVAPAARLARAGVVLNPQQGYLIEILGDIVTATPECAALFAPEGRLLEAGDTMHQPELADALERLASEGAEPFYAGDIAAAVVEWVGARGGTLTAEDLAGYQVLDRAPIRVSYRGHEVLTNPPPSAGGILIARALDLLEAGPAPPGVEQLVAVMERTQSLRTAEFLEGLDDPEFVERFLRGGATEGPLGSTTHIAVLDDEGGACSVTCSNGSCSGVVVPGTGLHLNNMLGEQDLNPLGFHRHPRGTAAAQHDGADDRPARRAPGARAGQRGLQPHPLGDPADRGPGDRRGAARARGGGGPANALRGRHCVRGAGDRYRGAGACRPDDRSVSPAQPVLRRGSGRRARRPRRLLGSGGSAARRRGRGGVGLRKRCAAAAAAAAAAMLLLAACGENVQSPDLFVLTRTGQGQTLTLLVNDSGTIRCDGRAAKPLARSDAAGGARPRQQPGRRRQDGAPPAHAFQ